MKSELMLIAGMLNDTADICKDIKAALKIKQIQIKLEKLINGKGNIGSGNSR